jgi:hypothetical protein
MLPPGLPPQYFLVYTRASLLRATSRQETQNKTKKKKKKKKQKKKKKKIMVHVTYSPFAPSRPWMHRRSKQRSRPDSVANLPSGKDAFWGRCSLLTVWVCVVACLSLSFLYHMMVHPHSQPLVRTAFITAGSSVEGTGTTRKRIIVAESDDALWYDNPRPPGATDDSDTDDDEHASTATAASTSDQEENKVEEDDEEEDEVSDDDVEEKKFQKAIREDGPSIPQGEDRIVALAWNHVQARQKAYQQQSQPAMHNIWKERGIGYAYSQYGIFWVVELPNRTNHFQPGLQTLTIRNIMNKHNTSSIPSLTKLQCSDWILWVRIQGPELLAGSAKPFMKSQQQDCHWEFPYHLKSQGTYHVDVKLFAHYTHNHSNPDPTTTMNSCQRKYNSPTTNSMAANCCAICSHVPNCSYWQSSLDSRNSSNGNTCQLYWGEKNHPQLPLVTTSTITASGPPEPMSSQAQFVGCASSFWGIPWPPQQYSCLDPSMDDAIPVFPSSQMIVSEAAVVDTNDESSIRTEK